MSTSFRHQISMDSLVKENLLPEGLQQHLHRVYGILAACLLSSAIGGYLDIYLRVGGILTTLATVGLMCLIYLDVEKQNIQKRIGILLAFGFCQGLSLGPLIRSALSVNPLIIPTAFALCTTTFICFSYIALRSPRASLLYMYAGCASLLSWMFFSMFLNTFFRSSLLNSFQLYGGLVLFLLYILVDTQMIVEKFGMGDTDYVVHAVDLFIDFVAIFTRLVIILMKLADSKKKKTERR